MTIRHLLDNDMLEHIEKLRVTFLIE